MPLGLSAVPNSPMTDGLRRASTFDPTSLATEQIPLAARLAQAGQQAEQLFHKLKGQRSSILRDLLAARHGSKIFSPEMFFRDELLGNFQGIF